MESQVRVKIYLEHFELTVDELVGRVEKII